MLHFTLSKFRARLISVLGVLVAVLMTNCCPPASMNGKIEKSERLAVAAKNDVAIATNAPAPPTSAAQAIGK